MPPIRTEKTNTAAAAQSPTAIPPKRRLLKPTCIGQKVAHFESSEQDWEKKYYRLIGTSTKTISFGQSFVLTE